MLPLIERKFSKVHLKRGAFAWSKFWFWPEWCQQCLLPSPNQHRWPARCFIADLDKKTLKLPALFLLSLEYPPRSRHLLWRLKTLKFVYLGPNHFGCVVQHLAHYSGTAFCRLNFAFHLLNLKSCAQYQGLLPTHQSKERCTPWCKAVPQACSRHDAWSLQQSIRLQSVVFANDERLALIKQPSTVWLQVSHLF